MNTIVLENGDVRAEILPERGARTQHLVDRRSGRELLWQGAHTEAWPRESFMESVVGGWDNIFPNDAPWNDYPDHGALWSRAFESSESGSGATLSASLERPEVEIEIRFSLLADGRRGLRQDVTLRPRADSGPVFWASHAMLAVEEGWRIDLPETDVRTDPELSGRLPKGAALSGADREPALLVEPHESMFELRFAEGVSEASVGAPDGSRRTRVSWDEGFLRHLWLITISGFAPIDLSLQIQPAAAHTYDLGAAAQAGSAAELLAGEERRFWVEIESLDEA